MKNQGSRIIIIGILVGLCVTSCYHSNTHEGNVDSLLNQIEDSVGVNPYTSRSKLLKLLPSVTDSLPYYKFYSLYVRSFLAANSFDTAFLLNKKIFQFCRKEVKPPDEIKKLLAAAYNSNGIYYTEKCYLDSALYSYKKALQLASLAIDSRYIDISINVADMFTRKGDYINGIGYYRKALFTSDSLGITRKMGFPIYFGLGQAYYAGLRDFTLSEKYFDLAWRLYPQRTFHEQFVYCNNRGNSYYYQQKYDRALQWFLKAKALVASGKYASYENLCYANLSDIYLKLGKLDSAQYYWNKSFQFFASAKGTTIYYYLATVKAGIALKKGNVAEAHSWLTLDKTALQIEPEIVGLRNQCWQEYYLKIGDYKNAYHSLLQNMHLNDSIRNEKVMSRIAEIDTRYRQDTAVMKREILLTQQNSQISVLKMTNCFWILLVVVIVIGAVAIYYSLQRKRVMQQLKFQDQAAQLRLQNIRNRISPHLMFNVLNQKISDEKDRDNQQLFDLVKLLRKSLEFTDQTLISLQDELEFVKTYIDLEQVKLGDEFKWHLELDDSIDTNAIKLPAMMIQIPVENALKHGLRNKTGDKKLSINISGQSHGVQILIRDNGTGFFPAAQSSTKGTGTGLKVLYQTIQLLNLKNSNPIRLSMKNSDDPKNSGAVADIFIPYGYHI